jgi:AraC-like DNA-binding protein
MSFVYEERPSDSPFVETIWRTQSESDGCYMNLADGCWDLLLIKQDAATRVSLCGPMTKAVPVLYKEGSQYMGIRFKIGAFMPHLPTNHILDAVTPLPRATSQSFWLGDTPWQLPDWDNVEAFVEKLARERLIARDEVVETIWQGQAQEMSSRSVQRHFLQTTGLTHNYLRQIERARYAASLLQQGASILETVYQAGYYDQSYLTKSLKRLIGQTPAQIVRTART